MFRTLLVHNRECINCCCIKQLTIFWSLVYVELMVILCAVTTCNVKICYSVNWSSVVYVGDVHDTKYLHIQTQCLHILITRLHTLNLTTWAFVLIHFYCLHEEVFDPSLYLEMKIVTSEWKPETHTILKLNLKHDFRFLLWCKWGLHCSGILRSVEW
jgi:hypothetical protein